MLISRRAEPDGEERIFLVDGRPRPPRDWARRRREERRRAGPPLERGDALVVAVEVAAAAAAIMAGNGVRSRSVEVGDDGAVYIIHQGENHHLSVVRRNSLGIRITYIEATRSGRLGAWAQQRRSH